METNRGDPIADEMMGEDDEFLVTERKNPTVDRQNEWLELVQSLIQKQNSHTT